MKNPTQAGGIFYFYLVRSRFFFFLALLAAVFAGMTFFFGDFLVYMILALIISSLLSPISNLLQRFSLWGFVLPKAIGAFISLLFFVGLMLLIVGVFVPLISDQIDLISRSNFNEMLALADRPIYRIENFMISYGLTEQNYGFLKGQLLKALMDFTANIRVDTLISNLLSFTGNVLVAILSVGFITFFLILENGMIKNLLLFAVPNAYFEVSASVVYKIERLLGNYLRGLMIEISIVFALVAIGLNLLRVEYAFTLAVFAGLTNLVPYLGPLVGTVFGVLVCLANAPESVVSSSDFFIYGSKVLSVFLFTQLVDNVVLQPLIYSRSVKAHPLEIFTVIFMGGALGGVIGMVSAVPAYTVLRVSVIEFSMGLKEFNVFKPKTKPADQAL